MKITSLLVFVVSMFVAIGTADAERWNNRGWVKLGEQTVNGKVDRDVIRVGAKEGKFTKLTLVIEGSDLELLGLEVMFANGQKFDPAVRHHFKEGSRTRVIDLPGDERVIQRIAITYKNTRGGGNARAEVWGWKTAAHPGRRGR